MKAFKSILEFQKEFSTEEKCREYLEQQRWNSTPACPFCGSINVCRFSNGRIFKCREKGCRSKFSVTVGTIYENTKIPLTKWFLATYILAVHSKGISSLQLATWLGVTQKTAWHLNHRIRHMLTNNAPELLDGICEVDETYVGGKNGNKHLKKRPKLSGVEGKAMVVGLLDRQGKVKTFVLPDTKQERIVELIKSNITKDAQIITDNHPSYRSLTSEGFSHVIIKKIPFVYITEGPWHTNNMEGYWSILKRGIYGIYHQVSPKHLQRYCNETAFRYNNRKTLQDERFANALANCNGSLKYKTLVGKK
ncbi:MAG: IS1595 family transposase [Flavisolibacter sp.]